MHPHFLYVWKLLKGIKSIIYTRCVQRKKSKYISPVDYTGGGRAGMVKLKKNNF